MQVGLAGCGLYVLSLRSTPLKAISSGRHSHAPDGAGSERQSALPAMVLMGDRALLTA